MSPEQRAACDALRQIIRTFVAIEPNLRAAHIDTLLTVALYPGVSVTTLAKEVGMSLTSASRHISAMVPATDLRPEGLGLVLTDIARDGRLKPLRLTKRGEDVMQVAADLLLSAVTAKKKQIPTDTRT
jgi:DNA-binding MarR family transcriptional regulator